MLDFGIAKLTDDAAQELTVAGQVFGTPWYMAPEQARGDLASVGPATDLWAIGLMAYQLLTGRNYWTADGIAGLVGQICYEPMAPPSQSAPHLGPLFDMWFERACNRDPLQRFTSATEMVAHLAQALGVNQLGPGITTDSAVQISVPAGQSNPGAAIPGTLLGQSAPGSTDAPLYATKNPIAARRSSMTAILLGVAIAVLIAGGGVGVYLGMEKDEPSTPASSPADDTEEDKVSAESDSKVAAEPTGSASVTQRTVQLK